MSADKSDCDRQSLRIAIDAALAFVSGVIAAKKSDKCIPESSN